VIVDPAVKSETDSNSAAIRLKGSLGALSIVLMVLATAAPLSVMVATSPLLISMGNGAAAPFDALVATVTMVMFTAGFVTMSRYITNAGAFYAYIQKGLGRAIGLGSATTALLSYFLILVAIETYMGYAIAELISSSLRVNCMWWPFSLLVIVVVGILGYRDIELSSKFLGIALILEIAVVIFVNAAIAYRNGPAGFDLIPFSPATIRSGSPGLGIMFAIYCFIGFEATVIFREEARDPDRTIPRATYIGVITIGLFYIFSMWCEVVGVGADKIVSVAAQQPADMYLILVRTYLGSVCEGIARVLLITSLLACVLSLHNVVTRYQYVLGRFGVLDRRLSLVHKVHGSPHVSSIVQTTSSCGVLLILVMTGLDPVMQIYAWGATAGTLGYMLVLSLTCVSVIAFFARNSDGRRVWQTRVAPFGALLGILFCLWVAVANLPALIGGEAADMTARVICYGVACSFAVGFLAALFFKRFLPTRFETLKDLA
jgi:amino acid transporter